MRINIFKKIVIFLYCTTFSSCMFASEVYWKNCPIGKSIASFNFSNGTFDKSNDGNITWHGGHGGVVNIVGEKLTGIEFFYKSEHPLGDSSSEWRYSINIPLSRTWEFLSIYQPKNFKHRLGVEITLESEIDPELWKSGDLVKSSTGARGVISVSRKKKIFLTDVSARYRKHWGNNTKIVNLSNDQYVYALDSKGITNNNKFSTQWQGDYSNSGMTVETVALPEIEGGELGYSYFRPTINRSAEHPSKGNIGSQLVGQQKAVAFDPKDNGKIVDFVIERVRATAKGSSDGSYRIWKRTESSVWQLIFENTNLDIYQEDNYFTNGYVFGWSNSGYDENTKFYLLKWSLWAEKPVFLP